MSCFLDVKGYKKHFLFIHVYKKVDSYRRIFTERQISVKEQGDLEALIIFLPLKRPSLSLILCFLDEIGCKKQFLFIHMYKKIDSFRRISTSEAALKGQDCLYEC